MPADLDNSVEVHRNVWNVSLVSFHESDRDLVPRIVPSRRESLCDIAKGPPVVHRFSTRSSASV
jgi:hypothetical protein